MVHEFEQVLPAFAPEAGLNVTQEGQVLLAGVRLGEQVLEGLTQGQQDQLVVHGFVPGKDPHQQGKVTDRLVRSVWDCAGQN